MVLGWGLAPRTLSSSPGDSDAYQGLRTCDLIKKKVVKINSYYDHVAALGSAGLYWSCLLERALRYWSLGDASAAASSLWDNCDLQDNPRNSI